MATPLQLTLQELETARNGYADWATFALRDATTNVCIAVVGEVDHYDSSNNKARAETIVRAVNAHEAMKNALKEAWWTLTPLDGANDPTSFIGSAIEIINKALTLAEGKE